MQNKINGIVFIGVNIVGLDVGLFLKMEICGVVVKLLVDIGVILIFIFMDLLFRVLDNDKLVLKDMK